MTTQYKIVTSDIEPEEHNLWLKWTDKLNPIPKIFMYLDGDWKPLNISREDLAELEADLSLRIDLFSDQFMEHITRLNSRITSNYEFIARIENTLNTQVATLNESIGRVQRNLDIEKIRLDGRIDVVDRNYKNEDRVLSDRISSNTNLFNGLSTRITNEIQSVNNTITSKEQSINSKIDLKEGQIYQKITSVQKDINLLDARKREITDITFNTQESSYALISKGEVLVKDGNDDYYRTTIKPGSIVIEYTDDRSGSFVEGITINDQDIKLNASRLDPSLEHAYLTDIINELVRRIIRLEQ